MILVTGSLAFDYIMDFPGKFSNHIMPDKIHQINLSFLVNKLSKQKGGTAGNIAYNLALLNSPVSIVGAVGADFSEYGKFLQDAGVDISKVKIIADESTSSAYIMTDMSDNQITAFYPGPMSQNYQLSLDSNSGFVVISPNDPVAMVKFAKEAKELGINHMVDPGMQLPALNPEDLTDMINGATILIGNDYEISLLCDKLQVTSDKLLGQVEILIITLGEKGSIIQTKNAKNANIPFRRSYSDTVLEIQAAKPNGVVDPTGAGDAYRAGFLAGYMKKLDLKTCGQMGSVAACYTVEKYGTTSHSFTLEEFKSRYSQNFGEQLNI